MTAPLDLHALSGLLEAHGVRTRGPLRATLIAGGRSNLTFSVDDEVSTWVVRRPPTSGLTPSAHDMAREFRVTKALQDSGVPVPRTVALDADGRHMGAPTSVVEFVTGSVVRSQVDLAPLTDSQVAALGDALVATLVGLHTVDHAAVGLSDFGKPDGFLDRQVRLWARQWDRVRSRDLPDVERLLAKLSDRIPPSTRVSIVHGDYRIDNTIVDVPTASVRAVVDWEMSTLGDPLTDLALMCVYRDPALDSILGLPAAWTSRRWPSADALAHAYATASGHDVDNWDFYLGLAFAKLAVVAEGIAHRLRTEESTSTAASDAAAAVPHLITAGLAVLR